MEAGEARFLTNSTHNKQASLEAFFVHATGNGFNLFFFHY